MDEVLTIKCLIDKELSTAILELGEDENYTIIFKCGEYKLLVEAENYFYALLELRKNIEGHGVKILCKGCSKYVYPSPMILSMGDAKNAYELKMGKPAMLEDLVNIFDPCDIEEYASIEEQAGYYQKWIESIQ